MWFEVTAKCGCVIEGDVDSYLDGCCDICYSTVTEVTSAEITRACEAHGG